MVSAVAIVFIAIVVLVAIANRINVAYPIVLVVGGMLIGFIPHVPTVPLAPDLVLVLFLPPLLFWESVTAPTSEFRSGAWWIFQMAFGLVVVTMLAVAWVAHMLIPNMSWGVAFVLGAIVASTDEVAFAAIADRLKVPRHIIGTIEGESLVNDATSLILYSVGIGAVVGASFSVWHAAGALVVSVVESVAIGLAAGGVAVLAWRSIRDNTLQGTISIVVPFLAYLPAYHLGASGVLATVTAGVFVTRYTPRVLLPGARDIITGFWTTAVFTINALIFAGVGIGFHQILSGLEMYSPWQLILYSGSVAVACIVVRLVWTFAQGLLPITNEPEHTGGKADWSHVMVLAWTGMRGGVSLAAALAIPLQTAAGPFPHRNLVIFITFVVLLATLVGQGGTLPLLIRVLRVTADSVDDDETRLALAETARAALRRIDELERNGDVPKPVADALRRRFKLRTAEFGDGDGKARQLTSLYRKIVVDVLQVERDELYELRRSGRIDNTILRRVQRLLDLETSEMDLLNATGRSDIED